MTDFNDLWNSCKQKVRTNYRRAEKNGLRSEIYLNDITQEQIAHLHDI